MSDSKIAVLGFNFHGGSEAGLMALFPKCSLDAMCMIEDAKAFLNATGAKWLEMTTISRDGKLEISKMYQAQDALASI